MGDGSDGAGGSDAPAPQAGDAPTPEAGDPAAVREPLDRRVLDPDPGHLRATLCHPIRERDGRTELLLMEKKRGIGEGNVIAPGGKIEPGERPREAAMRETREETGLRVESVEKAGELAFYTAGEPFTFVHVYRTRSCAGAPRETPEGDPRWYDAGGIPYDRMWEDDSEWLPHLLAGVPFAATFRFSAGNETLLDGEVRTGVEF